jgi:hypothetical protein
MRRRKNKLLVPCSHAASASPATAAIGPVASGWPTNSAPVGGLPAEVVATLAAALVDAARRLAAEADARTVRPGFINLRCAAAFLGVSVKTLRAMIRRRMVPCVRVNPKVLLFRPAALAEAVTRFEIPARRFV